MKLIFKITAVIALIVVIVRVPVLFSADFSENYGISANLVTQTVNPANECVFPALEKMQDANKIFKPEKLTLIWATEVSNLPSNRMISSYFFTNFIHYNQPLIQYKFPLSEHTEEG